MLSNLRVYSSKISKISLGQSMLYSTWYLNPCKSMRVLDPWHDHSLSWIKRTSHFEDLQRESAQSPGLSRWCVSAWVTLKVITFFQNIMKNLRGGISRNWPDKSSSESVDPELQVRATRRCQNLGILSMISRDNQRASLARIAYEWGIYRES